MQRPPIIFIWLGSDMPDYAYHSLRFCRFSNPNTKIYLLLDHCSTKIQSLLEYSVDVVIESAWASTWINNNCFLDHPLMLMAAKRLKVLIDFVDTHQIDAFFAAELDNIVFNLEPLHELLSQQSPGFFAPRYSQDKVILSLVYCNNMEPLNVIRQSLESSNQYYESEMKLLARLFKCENSFYSLPTEAYLKNFNMFSLVSPDVTKGVFDACAMGQYIFGVDPVHLKWWPIINLRINKEDDAIQWRRIKFHQQDSSLYIVYPNKKMHYIYNLHIHSKLTKLAVDNIMGKSTIAINAASNNVPCILSITSSLRYIAKGAKIAVNMIRKLLGL